MSVRRIRRAIREDRYEFTIHALKEMDEDDLTDTDVREPFSMVKWWADYQMILAAFGS